MLLEIQKLNETQVTIYERKRSMRNTIEQNSQKISNLSIEISKFSYDSSSLMEIETKIVDQVWLKQLILEVF